ncbi:ATPase involved in DNA repair [Salmonella enterica subsp. enterica serovar Typhi]|nr:ATPase involved in DNA repair [Salmonella enterica subsp. enterica serovar Typhi]
MMTDNVNLMNGDEQTASSLSEETSKTPPLSPELLKNSPYSSIAKVKYFTEIEQICLDKSISTENLDQFFKAHWLRDKMGGSFARAQEMLAAYKQYVDEVPEEARAIEIPDQIKDAFSDFTAFITWYFRLSYTAIQSDSVKIAKAEITQLRQRNAEILEELSQSKEQATVLNNEKVNLINLLEQQRELSSKLEHSLQEAEETLAGTQSELQHAQNEIQLIQQTVGTLNQQLSERKQELVSQQEYQKQLNDENKAQQVELTALKSQNDHLQRTVSDLKVSVSQLEQDLSSVQTHSSELSSSLAEKDTTLTLVRSELSTAKGENDQLRAEAQRLADESLVAKKVQTDQTEELQQLRNQMISMEATLNAEKTIAESLRGTIKQLTEAMTGAVAIKPKSSGASKPRNKKTT